MNEFDLIERYFAPLSMDGLKDDGAVLSVPEGFELAVSSDVLNEGVHFPFGEAPHYIAHKALRVNLSDLASMGAKPLCYQLGLALSSVCDESWLAAFSKALSEDQALFDVKLLGGDTTSTKSGISISMTAMGLVPKGEAVKRGGAKEGDVLVLSGSVGNALIGLDILRDDVVSADEAYLLECYRKPTPRVALAETLRANVHAAADISDGLIADAGHIAKASGLACRIDLDAVKFSDAAQAQIDAGRYSALDLMAGGDDYELAMAIAPEKLDDFMSDAALHGIHPQVIGCFEKGSGITVVDGQGQAIAIDKAGWQHF